MSLFVVLVTFACVAKAALFGGEDSRRPIVSSMLSGERYYLGTIVCDGRVEGTGILVDLSLLQNDVSPVLISAAHVLVSARDGRCFYAPMADERRQQLFSLSDKYVVGSQIAVESQHESHFTGLLETEFKERFMDDWAVVALKKWPRWNDYALPIDRHILESWLVKDVNAESRASVAFAGYSVATNSLMVDESCFLFLPKESHLINDQTDPLRSEDCEGTQGSSGGVLFAAQKEQWVPVGIHLGTAFVSAAGGVENTNQGQFDLASNTNVARLLDRKIVDALMEVGGIEDSLELILEGKVTEIQREVSR